MRIFKADGNQSGRTYQVLKKQNDCCSFTGFTADNISEGISPAGNIIKMESLLEIGPVSADYSEEKPDT